MTKSKEIQLLRYPSGRPTQEDFALTTLDVPAPADGEVLVRNLWMSVDPYMRGRMRDVKSYMPPFELGKALQGGAIGEVVESQFEELQPGDLVMSMFGWREYFTAPGGAMNLVNHRAEIPLQTWLGTLGIPGLTAYVGLLKLGEPKPGETVFVSAASGAVGAIVCQIAKKMGCRVVASAGSEAKIGWLRDTLGVDVAINYKTCGNLTRAMTEACPNGIDINFENVGSEHLQAALGLMNLFGRIVMCGMIDGYNDEIPRPGPDNLMLIIGRSLKMQGFIVSNHLDMMSDFERDMAAWIGTGDIQWKETLYEGIEQAPEAFLGLFSGDNFGKMLVRLS